MAGDTRDPRNTRAGQPPPVNPAAKTQTRASNAQPPRRTQTGPVQPPQRAQTGPVQPPARTSLGPNAAPRPSAAGTQRATAHSRPMSQPRDAPAARAAAHATVQGPIVGERVVLTPSGDVVEADRTGLKPARAIGGCINALVRQTVLYRKGAERGAKVQAGGMSDTQRALAERTARA